MWGNGMRESRELPNVGGNLGSREPGHTAQPKLAKGVFLEVASSTEAGVGKKLSWLGYHESHSTHTSQSPLWS